jgi:hypothetical protein
LRPVAERDDSEDAVPVAVEEPIDTDFQEALYLRAFPDIAEAVRRGTLASGLAHFRLAGRMEGRLGKAEYRALLEASASTAAPQVAVDALTMSASGCTLMTGWSDDRLDPLTEVSLETRADTRHNWTAIPRLLRADVARTLDVANGRRLGFLLVAAPVGGAAAPPIDARAANMPVFRFASGAESVIRRDPAVASDADLRDLALAILPTVAAGEPDPAVISEILDRHVGVQIAAINRLIAEQMRPRCLVERTGLSCGRFRASVMATLRGGADRIVPWLALIASGRGVEDYEFILTVTDPDQFEPAVRAAQVARRTIGAALTLVLQPGGDPNSLGDSSGAARSDRYVFMDQTVAPRDRDWALRHSTLLSNAPPEQTRLMGGVLYHPDGAISNAGYYFDRDTSLVPRGLSVPQRVATIRLGKVTHRMASASHGSSRPVMGVPAAFMSVDRAWFEALGGFTLQYCRAVHEDIDLCLRSLRRGVPAWIHELRMWQFAGRPSTRAEPSRGGAILNDWLFHRQWDSTIVPGFLGIDPVMPNRGGT